MRFFIGGSIGLLAIFSLVGLVVFVNALRAGRAERLGRLGEAERPHGLRERISDYVGPVDPSMALLNRPGRVALEFFTALCGFPGFGWIFSGAVFTGIVLICAVPCIVWGIYPVFLAVTGRLLESPFAEVQYLPGLALGSAALLLWREMRLGRRRAAARTPGEPTSKRGVR